MTDHRVALQPAYILHRRDYRETSLLIEAFSAEHGRVGLIAKGVRRGKGKLQGLLQPFRPLLVSWTGRGELRTLTDAEPGGPVPVLAGRQLYSGFYVNELLMRLLQREDPHPALFARYGVCLAGLAVDEEWALRLFERDLLGEIGYGLLLDHDTEESPLRPDGLYDYQAQRGPVPVGSGMRDAVHGRTLLALAGDVLPDERDRREAKHLLRRVLAPYLGDRPLESRMLYQSALSSRENEEEKE